MAGLFKRMKKKLGETELTVGRIRGTKKSKSRKLKDIAASRKAKKAQKVKTQGTKKLTQRGRQKAIGAAKGTKVSRGAVGVEKTKGGDYVKYKKDSKPAKSFRSAFKSNCAGKGSKDTFTWQGRKYSCAKK